MTFDARVRPHQIRPTDPDGVILAPGLYLAKVVAGGVIDGLVPALTGLTSADGSVTVTDNGDGTLDLAAAGSSIRQIPFKISGTLTTGAGATKMPNLTGTSWTISAVYAEVETAPSGGSVVVDVNVNGTTIFTTQANRPTITTGNLNSGSVTNMNVTTVAAGDYLTIDVDTTTAPAANLTVIVVLS